MNEFISDPVDHTGPQQGLGFELELAERVLGSIDESKLLDLMSFNAFEEEEEEFDHEF